MKRMGLALAAVGLLTAGACDKDHSEEAAAKDEPGREAQPRLGGTILTAGSHQVELQAHAAGELDAVVFDAQGTPLDAPDLQLSASVQTEAGKAASVPLRWDPSLAHFHGELDADAVITPGPASIELKADGKVHTGSLASLVVLPRAEHGGTMLVAGQFSAELITTVDGQVHAFISDLKGKPVEGDVDASFHATVLGADGAAHDVKLTWSAPDACFKGKLEGDLQLQTGPLVFVALAGGKAEAEARGRVEVAAVLPKPEIDGTLVVAGNHSVEVHQTMGHELEAVVHGPDGKLLTDGKAELEVRVQASSGAFVPVNLQWNAARARYTAKLQQTVTWGAPFRVRLRSRGRLHVGAVHGLPVVAAPRAHAHFSAHARVGARARGKGDMHTIALGEVKPPSAAGKLRVRAKGSAKPPRVRANARVRVNTNANANAKAEAKRSRATHTRSGKASAKAGASFRLGL